MWVMNYFARGTCRGTVESRVARTSLVMTDVEWQYVNFVCWCYTSPR